jgi:hypothetical protein
VELAKVSISRKLAGETEFAVRPLLCAGLEHPAIPPHRTANRLTFCYRYTQGFFAIHIFAGSCGCNSHQSMPMVLWGNHHGINIIASEQVAKVIVGGTALVTIAAVNNILGFLPGVGSNITNSYNPYILVAQKCTHLRGALAAHANTAHHDAIAWGNTAGLA